MPDTETFAVLILLAAAAAVAVLAASRLSERARVPLPALVLMGTAVVAALAGPHLNLEQRNASRLVTVALVLVLFDGGSGIGRRRLVSTAGPVAILGVAGTFATAALAAMVCRAAFGLSWYVSALVATAVAPTDPAVVFSVLGRKRVEGRSGTILEGESGANDPVGIAVMAGLIGAGHLDGSGVAHAAWTFALQMGVGAAIGVVGGYGLLWAMRHLPLPGEGLYPLRSLAGCLLIYGAGAAAHGSGFLAVFVAGILTGDERAPYKREIERFHGALASLAEMVAFVALGLTVSLHQLARTDTWVPGLVLWAVLAGLIRPAVTLLCLTGSGLDPQERRFVAFAGLKGAVPILLGGSIVSAGVPQAGRLYGIVVVVVLLSVLVQGGLTGPAASALGLAMTETEQQPWTFGVRLSTEPEGVLQVQVVPGSPAEGRAVADLHELPEGAWLSILVRDGKLLALNPSTVLKAGDRLSVLAGDGDGPAVERLFGRPGPDR